MDSISFVEAFDIAVRYQRENNLQKAEQLYRSILRHFPTHVDANHNLGIIAMQVGKPEKALPFLRTALEMNPSHEQLWLSYINALIKAHKAAEARQVLAQGKACGLTGEPVALLERQLAASAGVPADVPARDNEITLTRIGLQPRRKVFNLGFSKTGTTSIETALQLLGYSVARGHWKYHYCHYLCAVAASGDYDEVIHFSKSFDAFCDAPSGGGTELYKKLHATYPDAKFILSLRDPEKWYTSFVNLLTAFDKDESKAITAYAANGMWGSAYWFRKIFDIQELAGQKERIVDTYNKYNQDVMDFFQQQSTPLLVLDLSQQENPWQPLCTFLGHAVPALPFPKVNVTPTDWETNKHVVRTEIARALNLVWPLRSC